MKNKKWFLIFLFISIFIVSCNIYRGLAVFYYGSEIGAKTRCSFTNEVVTTPLELQNKLFLQENNLFIIDSKKYHCGSAMNNIIGELSPNPFIYSTIKNPGKSLKKGELFFINKIVKETVNGLSSIDTGEVSDTFLVLEDSMGKLYVVNTSYLGNTENEIHLLNKNGNLINILSNQYISHLLYPASSTESYWKPTTIYHGTTTFPTTTPPLPQ